MGRKIMKKNTLIAILAVLLFSPCFADKKLSHKVNTKAIPQIKNIKAWDFLIDHESAFVRYPSYVGYTIGFIVGIPLTYVTFIPMVIIGKSSGTKDMFFPIRTLGYSIYGFSCLTGGLPYVIYESTHNEVTPLDQNSAPRKSDK
jgi:hypothetical protein